MISKVQLAFEYVRGFRRGVQSERESIQPILHALATENLAMREMLKEIGLDKAWTEEARAKREEYRKTQNG